MKEDDERKLVKENNGAQFSSANVMVQVLARDLYYVTSHCLAQHQHVSMKTDLVMHPTE